MDANLILLAVIQLLFVWLAVVSALHYKRHKGRRQRALALMLGALAFPALTGALSQFPGVPKHWINALGSFVLMAHPYLLLQFLWSLLPKQKLVDRTALVGTLASALPIAYFPTPLPLAASIPLVVFFVSVEIYAALWIGHNIHSFSGISRWRMRLTSIGTWIMALLIFLLGLFLLWPNVQKALFETFMLFAFVSGIAFYLSVAPPHWLRRTWQLWELEKFLQTTSTLDVETKGQKMLESLRPVVLDVLDAVNVQLLLWKPLEQRFYTWNPSRLTEPEVWSFDETTEPNLRNLRQPMGRSRSEVSHPKLLALMNHYNTEVVKILPISQGEYQWGLLLAFLTEQTLFPDDDTQLLALLAQQTAQALRHTEHFQQQKQTADQLQLTVEVLRKVSQHKSEFLANMSHELRTPLNSIIGFSELLHQEKVGPLQEQQLEFLNDILTSSRHLLALLNDILDLSRIEAGHLRLSPERFSAATLVGEVQTSFQQMAQEQQLHLTTEVEADLPDINLDVSRFKQILVNLIANAIKFSQPGGAVTVRVFSKGEERFVVEVEDEGIGIRKEDVPRLFQKFEQLDGSRKKKFAGAGLGLALTQQLVEAQQGTIEVESEWEQGSTFRVTLPFQMDHKTYSSADRIPSAHSSTLLGSMGQTSPVHGKAEEPTRPTQQASVGSWKGNRKTPSHGSLEVLVVEDAERDRTEIASLLEEQDHHVVSARTAAEALDSLQKRSFDLITLDLQLPDASGWQLLAAIRSSQQTNLPVVVVSVTPPNPLTEAVDVEGYVTKPFAGQELKQVLQALRAAPESSQSNHVLVVDDNPHVAKVLQALLKPEGLSVSAVSSGEEALQALQNPHPYAAIILDLEMPNLNGFQFLQAYQATRPQPSLPIIVFTHRDLSEKEETELKKMARSVVLKHQGGTHALLQSLLPLLSTAAHNVGSEKPPPYNDPPIPKKPKT